MFFVFGVLRMFDKDETDKPISINKKNRFTHNRNPKSQYTVI